MVLGIQLSQGHFIVAAILIVIYDAIWTWGFHNRISAWWFERLQGLLKCGSYAAFLALVGLVVYTPWPWNLIIVLATIVSIVCIAAWLQRRHHVQSPTGTLHFVVSGLPAGFCNINAAGVTNHALHRVSNGPSDLPVPVGTYTVTANNVGALVATINGSPANVTADATANVTVAYA